ncbi:glutaminase B [Marinomonas posidonica]|uniref:Glutaminase n=1 Tax=Marinomonas posidonica (strain CECT 7376 / NCIMB 14433 / IVIA-Po-181) TaxID=491952 RepID=F6D0B2_MARPP|nr:glutaminase B [Marinomonas posidonica]AEF53634.1 Glutaminase [Marinomonas posidonica IVIA-Po-181]
MEALLQSIEKKVRPLIGQGKVADYIPALAQVDPNQFGIAIYSNDGALYQAGQADTEFSIQSISKVFSLTLAIKHYGEDMWQRVGREPSGNPFNSLVQLEYESGVPRNPFINAGALVISDMNQSRFAAPHYAMREFIRRLADNPNITSDKLVSDSEYEFRARNASMAYLMKAFGNFDNDVEAVLHNYFDNCAVRMNCIDLAKAFSFLANKGFSQHSNEQILSPRETTQVNGLLATSGLYDEAGNFAYRVGLPGKSGVGGGIIAIVPNQFSMCVWSPELNKSGNSLAGMAALEALSESIGWSVFG